MIDRVRFVLVRPEEPENVGAAARVMRNFGFGDLVLVDPRLGRPERAYVVAHRAEDIVLAATHVSRLEEALEGCVRAFATSRRSGKRRGQSLALREAALESATAPGPVAWVFGPESDGLAALEIERCSDRVLIPTAPQHPSLNLAQAAAVVAYELYLAGKDASLKRTGREASLEERDALYRHLEEALLAIGFLTPDTARARMGELRRLLERSRPSPEEVRFLRGIARRMDRAVEQTRPRGDRKLGARGGRPGGGNGE
jgi:TrmH family RNA methyltransferase